MTSESHDWAEPAVKKGDVWESKASIQKESLEFEQTVCYRIHLLADSR